MVYYRYKHQGEAEVHSETNRVLSTKMRILVKNTIMKQDKDQAIHVPIIEAKHRAEEVFISNLEDVTSKQRKGLIDPKMAYWITEYLITNQ